MSGDVWDDPEARVWRDRANSELRPMIEQTSASVTLWPSDGEFDAKIAVEVGFTLLLGKPLLILKPAGSNVPAHLARIAEGIVEYDEGQLDSPALAERIQSEVARILDGAR